MTQVPSLEETTDLMQEALQPTTVLPVLEANVLAASLADDETKIHRVVAPSLPVTPIPENPTEPPPAWLTHQNEGRHES